MRDGHDLPAHIVVESVDSAGVDEAVAHPESRLDALRHLPHHLKRSFNPVLVNPLIGCRGVANGLGAVAEDIIGVVSS